MRKSTINTIKKDIAWNIARSRAQEVSNLPAWGGFNAAVCTKVVPTTRIRYLPFIHASPSDMATIFTSLLKLVKLATALGQDHILVTADLAIYGKAQQILWTHPGPLAGRVTMRLGGMHLTMAFIASIGSLFGDGGLRQILTGSDVYADGTVVKMLEGKQYARGLRGIKLVHEALSHMFFSAAEQYAKDHQLPWLDSDTFNLMDNLEKAFKENDHHDIPAVASELEKKISNSILEAVEQFKTVGVEKSSTFKYWVSFLQAGDILLKLLRADREANFELHLDTVLETVQYFFLAGRVNYARYTTAYIAEMRGLERSHLQMFQHMQNGGFVVKRSNRVFNCVPTDQALEQSINKDAKSKGGVIGFTLRKGALLRWLLTRHISSCYSDRLRELCVASKLPRGHEESGATRKSIDQQDVAKIKCYINEQCHRPFDLDDVPSDLVNITTGQVASKEVEKSMNALPEKGQKLLEKFIEDRLVEKNTSFWAPIKKNPIVTFAAMKNFLTMDVDKKIVLDTEILFRRLLAVSKTREVDMMKLLKYELAAVPPSLFHEDGTFRKSKKADLAKKIEENCEEVQVPPKHRSLPSSKPTIYLIDGMAMLHSLDEKQFITFSNLALVMLKKIVRIMKNREDQIDNVTLVFDRYREISIKDIERNRRGATSISTQTHIVGNREVHNYRNFLKSSGNKERLAAFICDFICEKGGEALSYGKSITLAGGFSDGELVKKVETDSITDMEELYSNHEEADTRLLLHATYSAKDYSRVIVRCDDTDVLILLLYYYSRGELSEEVYMHAGHSAETVSNIRYVPIHTIAGKLQCNVCNILPAIHAVTGCDSTSSLNRIGKRTVFNVMMKCATDLQGLEDVTNDHDFLETARKFVLLLHGKKAKNTMSLDELRYILATTTDKPASQLPPTEDAFKQHVMRAQYQIKIWIQSHVPKQDLPELTEHGWVISGNNKLEPVYYLEQSAPVEVRDITHLYCSDATCIRQNCTCLAAGLPCIDICSCGVDCDNRHNHISTDAGDDEQIIT